MEKALAVCCEFALPLNHGHWWYCVNADHREGQIRSGLFMGGAIHAMPVLLEIMTQLGIQPGQYSFRHRDLFRYPNSSSNNYYVEIVFQHSRDAVLFKLSVPAEITRWSD